MFKKLIEKLYLKQKDNLAYHDMMTGCFNRNYFEKVFKVNKYETEKYLIFIDIDNLKKINDSLGHFAGDNYILNIVNSLNKFSDTIIRYGGDEFVFTLDTRLQLKEFKTWADCQDNFSYGIEIINANSSFKESIKSANNTMLKNKHSKKAKK